MNLSMVLFLIGILGFILNRKNIILMLISIEIMLLAVTLLIILSSFSFDDILGQTYGIYIIAIAGAESAIGLGILVAYYRLRGSDNYLVMFIGWEGVGISSYLLINFWFTRLQANKAAIKALVMNRVGDWGFSIGLWAIFWTFGNLDFTTVFSLAPFINEELITIISICLLVAAMGKSAQIGLHTWLPDAMEGPTPVSALIHAATMNLDQQL
ncbi:NADH:ubiquinone dehydrogenase subunit 5 [Rhizopus azygosporus]|uniref:NADH:ubiquinone dehydrogenase subunit 5 n=1 Tax=Rhizopus azygosporus TaxID=86630 RepID=A0A367J880_RHIAZ|nr:NADH:ubiquinone dehydrogenase subunit 5 [Rhizopus azygosporus]